MIDNKRCEHLDLDEQLSSIMNCYLCSLSGIALFMITKDGKLEWCNGGAMRHFGNNIEKSSGIYEILGEESRLTLKRVIETCMKRYDSKEAPVPERASLHFVSVNGGYETFSTSVFYLSDRNRILLFCEYRMLTDNEVMKKMAMMYKGLSESSRELSRERKQLQAANEKISSLASTDSLTGLANRRTLEAYLDSYSRTKKRALIMADLDNFKKINDSYGHKLGDEVLVRFANILFQGGRKEDLAARYGGEEFVVVLDNLDIGTGVRVAERIRGKIRKMKFEKYPDLKVTASFGVSEVTEGIKWQEALEKADQALYRAKRNGRDRVESRE